MSEIKIGLQMHAVREDFDQNPFETFKEIKKMGYDGVEFNYSVLNKTAIEYKTMLAESGLECFGVLVDWDNLQPDKLYKTIEYCHELGADKLIIGQVPLDELMKDVDAPKMALEYINQLYEILSKDGFVTGYHCHDSDFSVCYDGKSFYEYVMNNTDSDFLMVLDTGNTVAGGGDPLKLMKKYPRRALILHIKGYSEENKYLTPVWESDYDIENVITDAIEAANTQYFDIEFGARGEYDPMERAQKSAKWLIEKTKKWR